MRTNAGGRILTILDPPQLDLPSTYQKLMVVEERLAAMEQSADTNEILRQVRHLISVFQDHLDLLETYDALKEIERGEEPISWEDVKARLSL